MSAYTWLPTDGDDLAAAADEYGVHGWSIFPLSGKVPLPGTAGFRDATTDPTTIAGWWQANPHANIGWTPPEGWIALDVDPRHGGEHSLRAACAEHGQLPFTLRQSTGSGGEHYMFRAPPGLQLVQRAGVLPGIDVRVGGKGYLVVCPSVHPETRRPYRWHTVSAPADAPAWLLHLVAPPKEQPPALPTTHPVRGTAWGKAALRNIAAEVAGAVEGTRNDTLNRAAFRIGRIVEAGLLDEHEARVTLRAAGIACGLPDREVDRVLR